MQIKCLSLKYSQLLVFGLFFFLSFGLFSLTSNAAIFPDNFSDTGSLYCGGWQQGIFQPIGSGYDGTLSNIRVKGSLPLSGNFYARLYEFTDKTTATLLSTNNSLTISEDSGYITATFDNITINSGSYYQIAFMNDNTTANLCIQGGASGQLSIPFASYPDGDNAYYFSNPTWHMQQNNIYMDWNYGGGINSSLDLNWNSPAISGTSTFSATSFTSWLLLADGLEPDGIYDLKVLYGKTSSTLIYSDSYAYSWTSTLYGTSTPTSSILAVPLQTALTPPEGATSTVWFANAWIQKRGTETRVFSGIVAFTITQEQGNYTYFATSTAPELFNSPAFTENENSTSTTNILQRFAYWLFVPSTSTMRGFADTLYGQCDFEGNNCSGGLLQVFPFNLVFDFANTVQTASKKTIADKTLTLSNSNLGFSLDILTPTVLEDAFGSEVKNKWFEIQKNAFWLATGLFIITTIL